MTGPFQPNEQVDLYEPLIPGLLGDMKAMAIADVNGNVDWDEPPTPPGPVGRQRLGIGRTSGRSAWHWTYFANTADAALVVPQHWTSY